MVTGSAYAIAHSASAEDASQRNDALTLELARQVEALRRERDEAVRSAVELRDALEREYERSERQLSTVQSEIENVREDRDFWLTRARDYRGLLEAHAPEQLKAFHEQEAADDEVPF